MSYDMEKDKRKVVVYKNVYHPRKDDVKPHWAKEVVGNGIFHQFGVDYEEFDEGPGNFTTAIVEMPDGTVKNVSVELIVFNN